MYTLPQVTSPIRYPAINAGFVQAVAAVPARSAYLPMTTYNPAAAALDAADGVIDGKYFGSPIVGSGVANSYLPVTAYGSTYGSAAAALDAADGIMDGKFFGSRIIGEVPSAVTVPMSPIQATSVLPSSYLASPVTVTTPAAATSVVLPPADMSVITNVPPLGTTSVSVVDCHGLSPVAALPPSTTLSAYQGYTSVQNETTIVKRELPGAAVIAAEFRDLRDMLDRDRSSFEAQRAEFERSMSERELKLKMEQEKLTHEWTRLRAEQQAFEEKAAKAIAARPMPPIGGDVITVKTLKEGQDLDVKDGIIDGKFNGKQIVIQGVGPLRPPPHLMGKRLGPPGGKGKGGKGMPPPPGPAGPGSPPRFVLGQTPQIGAGTPPAGKGMPPGKGGVPTPGKGMPAPGRGMPLPGGKGKGGK